MKIRNFVTGAVVAAAVAATAACGSDDGGSDLPPVPTAESSSSASDGGSSGDPMTDSSKVPSVKALNEMLQTALDPDVKPAEKTELVEGSEVDPKLFDQLVKASEDNPDVTYKIKPPVTKNGPNKAKVKVEVKLPDNPPQPIDAAIVFDKGRWKLSKSTVCPLLSANDVKTPLCADGDDDSSSTTSKKKSN